MRFEKPALALEAQVAQWQAPRTHQFLPGTTFEQVLGLYVFDRKLRLLVMEALERVEVAVRTRWAHALAMRYGAHAYLDRALFKNPVRHADNLRKIRAAVLESKESFVQHYRATYSEPDLPPIWAAVEMLTLGALSHWVKETRDNTAKQEMARALDLPTVDVLERVLHALTPLRNTCAHHSRLWNRRMVMALPHIQRHAANLVPSGPRTHNLYNYLVLLGLMMKKMNPGGSWTQRVRALIHTELAPNLVPAMGFPVDWTMRPVWVESGTP